VEFKDIPLEEPKYKKKKTKKSPKKSNHKHEFVLKRLGYKLSAYFINKGEKEKHVLVQRVEICVHCQKERTKLEWLKETEFQQMVNKLCME
jgi:hypothetical protein